MSIPVSSSINEFLRWCLNRAATTVGGSLVVVMGNEGGDMDSIIGSIYLAMLFNTQKWSKFGPAIPILNFPAGEMPLRNDVVHLLNNNASTIPYYCPLIERAVATDSWICPV